MLGLHQDVNLETALRAGAIANKSAVHSSTVADGLACAGIAW
jgi:hypothetical protein